MRVSTELCPKVPARWPSVQFGLPRPAGEGSMKPKPDEGEDPAKCLSAGSSKHMPLSHPADVYARIHVCIRWYMHILLGPRAGQG